MTMCAPTYWGGKRLKAGDVVDVGDVTGIRWAKSGLAVEQPEEPVSKPRTKKTTTTNNKE